ncbi:MAG: hypothetical protein QW197_03190 [Candidatus Aenigmatarchaeota archaeon]
MKLKKLLKTKRFEIFFSLLGILTSFITFSFYYKDVIGLTVPFLLFLFFCFYFGREKKFLKFIGEYLIYFFVFWLITLTILVNFF